MVTYDVPEGPARPVTPPQSCTAPSGVHAPPPCTGATNMPAIVDNYIRPNLCTGMINFD